ncbi:MAG TPA: class I lanthipeptide [Thermoanaerobaculia bacterium]
MKKNGNAKKLTLHRDTLSALADPTLENAVGGFSQAPICKTGYTCPECAPID